MNENPVTPPAGPPASTHADGVPRRDFMAMVGGAGAGMLAAAPSLPGAAAGPPASIPAEGKMRIPTLTVSMEVNGRSESLEIDARMTLLDALRERLDLTGSKKGCDQGQCGACTVLVNGRRVLSCLTLAAQADGQKITTIEGLAHGDELHPMQAAFIECDGFQCGYCTPGQICSAVALLEEAKRGEASYVTENLAHPPTRLGDDEIRERMSGNLCRCAAYPQILAAIRSVHGPAEAKTGAASQHHSGEVQHAGI